jgi:NADH dehydrogenase FAD-containing subunit
MEREIFVQTLMITFVRTSIKMNKHFLLVGAGHAHLSILKNLNIFFLQGHQVIVISPETYHYYSGMGPGMLSGKYRPQQIRFHVEKMVTDQGGHFIRDEVVHIDPRKQTVQTTKHGNISYDIVSFNTGSYVPYPENVKNFNRENFIFPVKPIRNLLFAKNKLISLLKRKKPKIVVVGGGAAGVEMATNLRALAENFGQKTDIIIVAGGKFLNQFNDRFREAAKTILRQLGINLLEGPNVESISYPRVTLNNGISLQCDMVIWAVGISPSSLFKDSGLPTGHDDGLLVNEYLQSISFPNIFGGGDCISFNKQPLEKVGVYAVRQNPILLKNMNNFSGGKPLIRFVPQKDFLTILNMGNGQGLLKWKSFVFKGKAAFQLKDFIDQRFMKKFQISNERG